jgi:RNA polymerase sigma-70 factor (ECF subfamily)
LTDQEQIIVNRLRNKDKRAFELVYREYYPALVSYAFRFLDSRENAEEIVQDTFIKFWEKCAQLSANSSVKSYLYRAVHNSCLNHLKHEKVKDAYRQYVIQYLEDRQDATSIENADSNQLEVILKAIDNLPPRCSEIFKLSRLEGLKYQEIADHLSISVKTVEVQMSKALKILRAELKSLA